MNKIDKIVTAKINKLDRAKAADENEVSDLQGKIATLTAKIPTLQAEATAAASAGDFSAYSEKLAEIEKTKTLLDGHQLRLKNRKPYVTEELVMDAWGDYEASYNKSIQSHLEAYKKLKKELLESYRELIEWQRVAFETRERLAGYLDIPEDAIERRFHLETIPAKQGFDTKGLLTIGGSILKDPDACFYLASLDLNSLDLAQSKEQATLGRVLAQHRS